MDRRGVATGHLWVCVLAAAVVYLGGCADNVRPRTVPLTGKVTINGQPPGETGKLFFTPTQAADGYGKRPASGSFDETGYYRVMSWEPDDGLVPGRYTVNVLPANGPASKIPTHYRQSSTSGLELDVPVQNKKHEYNVEIRTN